MKTRTYLLLMGVAILVPVTCLSVLGLAKLLESERESRIRAIQEMANSASLQIDNEIGRAEASLRVIAHSREMQQDDVAGLYRLAAATRTSPLSWTLIADDSGNGVINTLVPFGTPLARNTGPWAAKVIDAQKTQVGRYFIGNTSKRGVVSVNVPAAGGQRKVVTQIFDPRYFNMVFHHSALKPGWIVGVFDAKGLTIARNKGGQELLGTPIRPELVEASRQRARGVLRHETREGIEVYDMFVRSELSGWTVAIGVPVAEIESAARQTTQFVALAVLAILGAAVFAAAFFARRIDRALEEATEAARALAKGAVARVTPSRLQEADELLSALHRSSLALSMESDARAKLEQERSQLLESERSARIRAESQDRAKDSFIAMLSHELRNPLAALTNAITLLRFPHVPAVQAEKAWAVVSRQLAHLTRMVDDLLDMRRVLTGKIHLTMAPVNVGELLQFACDSRMLAQGKRQHWNVETVAAWTNGDRARLMQVIDNLLVNAAKFTPDEGTIRVRNTVDGQWVTIEVADTGAGMSPDVIASVFESLVQGPTTIDRSQGGLGLGLAIARGLVEMHGGTISAHSDGLGKGATFTVRLPRSEPG